MGTSHAAPAPSTKKWSRVVGSLKNPDRTAKTVFNATISAALPLVPTGYISAPVICAAYEGLRFATEVRKIGLQKTVAREAIWTSEKFLIPSISNGLWDLAKSKLDPEFTNTPFGKLAEAAFKKTLNSVLTKGVQALEE
jgi:hypothetical protein